MFRSLSTSWELAKASYQVLRSDRQLIIFPLISSILTFIVAATFIIPIVAYYMIANPHGFATSSYSSHEHTSYSPLYYVGVFAFYLSQYFVILFANTALVSAAIIRLRGGTPTVADGFKVAWSRVGSILGYAAR